MASGPQAPMVLPPARLAEVLAILVVDLVEVMEVGDRPTVLETLASRLDEQGRTAGGSKAAAMLGAIGAMLMQLEG